MKIHGNLFQNDGELVVVRIELVGRMSWTALLLHDCDEKFTLLQRDRCVKNTAGTHCVVDEHLLLSR